MKNILFFLCLSTSLFGQTFVNTENQWVVLQGVEVLGSFGGGSAIYQFGNQVNIDGIDYLQLELLWWGEEGNEFPTNIDVEPLEVYFREDPEGRVYRKFDNQTESLFYDFSLEIGDTFGDITLTSKDSMILDIGEKRETFVFDNGTIWIRGIGEVDFEQATKGLHYPDSFPFLCFFKNEELFHKVSPEEFCFFLLVNEKEEFANQTKIYPNPVTDLLTIETEEIIEQVIISDISGREILKRNLVNEISVGALSEGIYFLKFTTNSGKEYQERIFKL